MVFFYGHEAGRMVGLGFTVEGDRQAVSCSSSGASGGVGLQ